MDRFTRQNINMKTVALHDTLDQIELIDIFRSFNPKAIEYILFASAHGSFFNKDHMIGHKTNLNKFMTIKIIYSIFYNGMKTNQFLKVILKNTWRLYNKLLKMNGLTIRSRITRYLETNEIKAQLT